MSAASVIVKSKGSMQSWRTESPGWGGFFIVMVWLPALVILDQINFGGVPLVKPEDNSTITSNSDAPVSREIAFEPVKPKAWQLELFRPHRNVEPGQHPGRLLDMLRAHATPVVLVVEYFQTAMLKATDHLRAYIVTIASCQPTG